MESESAPNRLGQLTAFSTLWWIRHFGEKSRQLNCEPTAAAGPVGNDTRHIAVQSSDHPCSPPANSADARRQCVAQLSDRRKGAWVPGSRRGRAASDRRKGAWSRSSDHPCSPPANSADARRQCVAWWRGWASRPSLASRPAWTLERGAGQARQYQQTGGPLSAQPVRGGRIRRHPLCQAPWHQVSALGRSIAGTTSDQSRCHRPCQQARPNGVGNDGQWQLSSRAEGLTRSRRVPWRDVKVGRANRT